jgi:hypothetical protein
MSTKMHADYGAQPLGGVLGKSGRVKFSATGVISVKTGGAQPVAEIAP